MAMKLSMPIGVDDFKKVRENYYFVDKSFRHFFLVMQKSRSSRGRDGLARR